MSIPQPMVYNNNPIKQLEQTRPTSKQHQIQLQHQKQQISPSIGKASNANTIQIAAPSVSSLFFQFHRNHLPILKYREMGDVVWHQARPKSSQVP